MYLLIFEAWATLCGFKITDVVYWADNQVTYLINPEATQGQIFNNSITWEESGFNFFESWADLALANPTTLLVGDAMAEAGYYGFNSAQQALMLANIMTHISLILIFVFVVMFFVFLFRLVSGFLSGRR